MDNENLPKGMTIIHKHLEEEENISLSNNNYVKIILNKINEIDDLDVFILNINANETKEQTVLSLTLKLNKKVGE